MSGTVAAGKSRWTRGVLLALVLIPTVFNAVMLWPEVSVPVPHVNDDAHHFLFIQRANEALSNGENVFDHWLPEVELGFPFFFYYQELPHLTVVALYRLLLGQVSLLTLYNVIRYILLVGLPLTVYWSMRRLGFSIVAGATAAMASSLPQAMNGYGLEYGSYIWRGYGMYTQLWAVHLFFITLACLGRLLERGKGYAAAAVALSALGLVHLFYSYAMAPAAVVLVLVGANRQNIVARVVRLAVVGAVALVVTAYLWLPFSLSTAFLNASPNLPRWRYDSFGAEAILTWLVNGDLVDLGRWPVLTLLLAVGVAGAITSLTRSARIALGMFAVMLVLFFGPATWGKLFDVLPMHEGLPFHRFIGPVHIAALLLIGLGGEWLWGRFRPLPERLRVVVVALVLLALIMPALVDRYTFYAVNIAMMRNVRSAIDNDEDARTVLGALRGLPAGRTYTGLRANWGGELRFGEAKFFHLLTFHRVVAMSPPYASHSLVSDLIWHFDDRNPGHYELFDVRYVIAPSRLSMPEFLHPVTRTPRYVLYRVDTGGYARFASIAETRAVPTQRQIQVDLLTWFRASGSTGRFVRYDYPATASADAPPAPACPEGAGRIDEERVLPGRFDLRVECPQPASVMLKVSYHPNWRITVDGRPVRSSLLSPGFIGFEIPAGGHRVVAEYRSPVYKTVLLVLGGLTLIAAVLLRRHSSRLEALLAKAPR